jgi:hypothetical protein
LQSELKFKLAKRIQKKKKKTKQKNRGLTYLDRSPPSSPVASPPGAQGEYRFALSPMGGTHLIAVIISIFFLPSPYDRHDIDELHVDAVFLMTTMDICCSPPTRPHPPQPTGK